MQSCVKNFDPAGRLARTNGKTRFSITAILSSQRNSISCSLIDLGNIGRRVADLFDQIPGHLGHGNKRRLGCTLNGLDQQVDALARDLAAVSEYTR